jgi:hypothetical protein
MIRLTYRSRAGERVIEDLVGPSSWKTADYRRAITQHRPGIEILKLELMPNDAPQIAIDGRPQFRVTLRVPGRPNRTVLVDARTHSLAERSVMSTAPAGAAVVSVVPHRVRGGRRPTDSQVREMFTSTESNSALARRFGCSPETVRQARAGLTHAHLRPEVLPGRPSCEQCMHYSGDPADPCGMGFPDPIEVGLGFALDCAVFGVEEEEE